MSQTANGYSFLVNTLATGIAGIGFDVVPPIVEAVTREGSAVDCSTVRHSGEGMVSPRRVRGHNGSASYRPDETECAAIPGYDRLSRLSPERRLELLGTMLVHCDDVSALWRRCKATRIAEHANRIGFGGVSVRTMQRNHLPKATTLRDVVATIDHSRPDSAPLAESICIHLDNLASGFGHYLLATEDVQIAAKLSGISKSTAYRLIESVRDSWEISADLAD